MKLTVFSFAAAGAWALAAPCTANNVVDLGYIKYQGSTDSTINVTSWNGIYYAASPEGALRWRPPVDIEKQNNYSSSQIINATQYGPSCLQGIPPYLGSPSEFPAGEENCLLLNVHKPSSPVSKQLPVMIQIHGGGYVIGNSQSLPGQYLVSNSRGNVIYVEIQYRLGGLGWLGGKAIKEDGSLNVGYLDQRAALNWVQRHIAAFGGDPDKVTIIGGSAGGASVIAQMQLYGGEPNPPFRAAVAEYPAWQVLHTDEYLETQYELVLNGTGCADLDCMRKLPLSALAGSINNAFVEAFEAGLYGHGDFFFGPSIDGDLIREPPTSALRNGNLNKLPLWTDHDALEGLIFSNTSLTNSQEVTADLRQLWSLSTDAFLTRLLDQYYPLSTFNGSSYFSNPPIAALAPNTTLGRALNQTVPGLAGTFGTDPSFWQAQQILGDALVGCPTAYATASLAAHGVPAWKMVFNKGSLVHGAVDQPLLSAPEVLAGPAGAVYGTPQDQEVLTAYLVAFVVALDPNAKVQGFEGVERPMWPIYGPEADVLYFNITSTGVATDAERSERCDFLFANAQILQT